MALPENKIKKIKLPGDVDGSQTYDIVPEKLGKDGYSAELPTLTRDGTLAISNVYTVEPAYETLPDWNADNVTLASDLSAEVLAEAIFKPCDAMDGSASLASVKYVSATVSDINDINRLNINSTDMIENSPGNITMARTCYAEQEGMKIYVYTGGGYAALIAPAMDQETEQEEITNYYIIIARTTAGDDDYYPYFLFTSSEKITDEEVAEAKTATINALLNKRVTFTDGWKKEITDQNILTRLTPIRSKGSHTVYSARPQGMWIAFQGSGDFTNYYLPCADIILIIPVFIGANYIATFAQGESEGSACLAVFKYVEAELTPLVEKTHSELKTMRTDSQLTPGTWYRITDYTTTTTQSNTSSADHQFDIIVRADSVNKLNENAYAIQHNGDTYFANSDLSAWKLNYCLDNDTDRFVWAGSSNGKGVVYRMIDEFNNDCPYDFKNILFTSSGKYTNAYTFSYTEDSTIKDASLLGLSKLCYDNVMMAYINGSTGRQPLNSNVFYSTDTSFGCYSNSLGYNCYLDTFGNGCVSNTLGEGCYSDTFGNGCSNNTLEDDCYNNTFGNDCANNTFGNGCYSNTLGNSCTNNAFKDGCYSNTFRNNCSNNILGHSYHHNVSENFFWYNVFGNNCAYNYFGRFYISSIFGNECRYVTFGDSSSAIEYCRDITIDSGCQNLYINSTDTSATSSNYLQNIHIHFGVTGESSSSRETITVSDRNLPYETNVYMNADGNVYTIINEGEGGGSYETATEEEIRALFSTQVADSQGNVITDANDQIIAVS